MYQDNAYMSSNENQWFSLPSYYTVPGYQQNVRVQNPVPNYLASEASVNYQYQSLNPVNQYEAPSIYQYAYGLTTDHQPAYHYPTPGAFFNQSLPENNSYQTPENNSYQTHLTSIIVYGTQSRYAKKDQRLEAFVDAICRGDLGRDLYSYNGGSRGQSQSRIRKQYGNLSLKDPRIRKMVSRAARHSPIKRPKHVCEARQQLPPPPPMGYKQQIQHTQEELLCSDLLKCTMR
ncbi:uncharacterized protein LOC144626477 isoform X2 [Crassostrea virginica]